LKIPPGEKVIRAGRHTAQWCADQWVEARNQMLEVSFIVRWVI